MRKKTCNISDERLPGKNGNPKPLVASLSYQGLCSCKSVVVKKSGLHLHLSRVQGNQGHVESSRMQDYVSMGNVRLSVSPAQKNQNARLSVSLMQICQNMRLNISLAQQYRNVRLSVSLT